MKVTPDMKQIKETKSRFDSLQHCVCITKWKNLYFCTRSLRIPIVINFLYLQPINTCSVQAVLQFVEVSIKDTRVDLHLIECLLLFQCSDGLLEPS